MKRTIFYVTLITVITLSMAGLGLWWVLFPNWLQENVPERLQNWFPQDSPAISQAPEINGGSDFTTPTTPSDTVTQTLQKITSEPVAAAVIVVQENGVGTTTRYIERKSGHVYDVPLREDAPLRITNTTVPRIQEAMWSEVGTHVLVRYLGEDLERVESYLAEIIYDASQGETGRLEGVFLPPDIHTVAINQETGRVFYILPDEFRSQGISVSMSGDNPEQLFTFPLSNLEAQYTRTGNLFLGTRPRATIPGNLYQINSGLLERVLGGKNGLTANVSPDGTQIAVSESTGDGLGVSIFVRTTQTERLVPFATLPEKCVWGRSNVSILYCLVPNTLPRGEYPDAWYQGRVSFSDSVWKVATDIGEASLIKNLEDSGELIDGIQPVLAPDDSVLVFINKKDGSLWSLTLPQDEAAALSEAAE